MFFGFGHLHLQMADDGLFFQHRPEQSDFGFVHRSILPSSNQQVGLEFAGMVEEFEDIRFGVGAFSASGRAQIC